MKTLHSSNFSDSLNISDSVGKGMGGFYSFKTNSDDSDLKWKLFLNLSESEFLNNKVFLISEPKIMSATELLVWWYQKHRKNMISLQEHYSNAIF